MVSIEVVNPACCSLSAKLVFIWELNVCNGGQCTKNHPAPKYRWSWYPNVLDY
jgi:hypothetical protein